MLELSTPHGIARAHIRAPRKPAGAVVLGHGAGGGVDAPDIQAAAEAAAAAGLTVVLVEQPYRVAGKRVASPAAQLDAAWLSVVEQLGLGQPLIVGGRSAGARVACRTAAELGAAAVLCLAFPVHPPGRPEKTRIAELEALRLPTLVVQGERDPFGMPPPGPNRQVVAVPGTHTLRDAGRVKDAVAGWLRSLL